MVSEQKSDIFSNKYHCLCNERPAGVMMSDRWCADGDPGVVLRKFNLTFSVTALTFNMYQHSR